MGPTRHLVILLMALVPLLGAAEVERDDWYVGTLGGTPSATVHQRWERLEDGGRAVSTETAIVINRALGGKAMRLEVRDRQRLVEDAQGVLVSGTFEHDEGTGPVVAVAQVSAGRLTGSVTANGRTQVVDQALAPGVIPRGDAWVLMNLASATTKQVNASVALMSNRLLLVTTTATPVGVEADGARRWSLVMDAAPVPMTMTVRPPGVVVRMGMSLGPLSIQFVPSNGPVPLVPADLSPAGLVAAAGPAPATRGSNRLLLPEGVTLADNPFQTREDDVVTLADVARADPPRSEDTAPSSGCESDAPELVAWAQAQVAGIAEADERIERLRLAVRAHITTKDLSVAEGTALQTLRSRTGDCSEHAALVAGALRAVGIPARVTVGLVFSKPHGGWVGHAWAEAWTGRTWVLADAAYPGINRCCYLALGTAGDQGAAAALLGTMAGILGKTITVTR